MLVVADCLFCFNLRPLPPCLFHQCGFTIRPAGGPFAAPWAALIKCSMQDSKKTHTTCFYFLQDKWRYVNNKTLVQMQRHQPTLLLWSPWKVQTPTCLTPTLCLYGLYKCRVFSARSQTDCSSDAV